MSVPKFFLQEIKDPYTRKAFEQLLEVLRFDSPLRGFKHFEVTFDQAIHGILFEHGLGFKPQDIIMTSITGTGSVEFRYGDFNNRTLLINATGPCVVRFFAGTYNEGAT